MPMFSHLFGLSPDQQMGMEMSTWNDYRRFADSWMKSQEGSRG